MDYTDPAFESAFRDLRDRLDNDEFHSAKLATEAFKRGGPAFWMVTRQHSGVAILADYANTGGGIEAAWRAIERDFHRLDARYESPGYIELLIPLNEAAVQDMARVNRVIGSWDREPELRQRAARHGWVIDAPALQTAEAV